MSRSIAAVVVSAVLAFAAPAGAQHFDVFFAKAGPRTEIGAFDFDGGGVVVPGVRVFERALALSGGVYAGSNPGFTAGAASYPFGWNALPANTDVPFEVLRERTLGLNLLHWDGAGAPSFGPVPDDEVLVIDENGCITCQQVWVYGGTEDLEGFVLDQTGTNGSLHVHHDWFVLGDAALSDVATPGVYLVALRARAGTLDWTPPFFVALGAGATAQQLVDAADWIDVNLVFPGCSDGTDNDGDGKVDWNGGPLGEPADDGCQGNPNRASERPPSSCGLGVELAALLAAGRMLRARIARRRTA